MNCPECKSESIDFGIIGEGEHKLYCCDCDWSVSLSEVADALEITRRVNALPEGWGLTHYGPYGGKPQYWIVDNADCDDMGEGKTPLETLRNAGIGGEPATKEGV